MGELLGYLIFGIVLWWIFAQIKSGWREQFGKKVDVKQHLERTSAESHREPTYKIEYVDADGVITIREISPESSKGTKYSLKAYCHLRNDWRTFLLERMKKVWKLPNLEALSSEEFYYDMRGRLIEFRSKMEAERAREEAYWDRTQEVQKKKEHENRPALVECWETFGDALHLMAYFGKADNRFIKAEKQIIRSFLEGRAQAVDVVDDVIRRLEKIELPTLKDIDKLLSRIAKEAGDEMRRDLVSACHAIVAADKKEHEDETVLLKRMQRVLVG
jgi:uncharacterized tellurite resistance protein B-like protein